MFNFHNIGGKIKSLAKFIFVFDAVCTLIVSGWLIIQGIIDQISFLSLLGCILLVLGPIAAWVSTWLLYGFGQLIENTDILSGRLDHSAIQQEDDDDMVVYCPHCNAEIPVPQDASTGRLEMHCPECSTQFIVQ